ncbi:phenylacetate--CoA ligase family protein [Bacillota bacterium]
MSKVKWLIENGIYPYMEKRRGNQIRKKTEELINSSKLSSAELCELQKLKLMRLLFQCIVNVPAYEAQKKLEDEIIEDPFSALRKFPVLSKSMFKENFDTFISRDVDRSSLIANYTGGSTSEPVKFYMDRHMVEYYEAARWRGLSWWGITAGSPSVMIWGNPLEMNKYQARRYRFKERWLKNRIMLPAYAIIPGDMRKYVGTIESFSPEYIYGYASALNLFSELMLNQELSLNLKLKAVVSTAETLHDFQRQTIERAFGCPVINEYGARDGGIIAYQCREGKMHISAENAVLEVVDSLSLEPVPAGNSGLLLVTDLNNFVMPRLRYQVGDRAVLSAESCACGMGLPILEKLDGREDDMFVTVDGKYIHGHAFNHLARQTQSVGRFQIIQENPSLAVLLIVTNDEFDNREIDEFIAAAGRLLPGTKIDAKIVKDIPVSASGKFRYTIRKFTP